MCGITGIFNFDNSPVDRLLLQKMTVLLRHRGPDGSGYFVNGNVGLGHRRLKIIDLSENGQQPISNEDGSVWVTYNGEIYNFSELSAELKKRGHVFKSRTDTEVIVHAYEEWGIDCLERFNGMFAFALHDKEVGSLFLVRDRIGIKPLFYFLDSKRLMFGSEIKAILADPTVPREIDVRCLHNYLSLNYVTAPHTLFKDIKQLLPGHYLKVSQKGSWAERYWNISFAEDNSDQSCTRHWLTKFDHTLNRAVERRLVSDVPFGALLSGGLDSSSVVYYMSKIKTEGTKTFSIGFEEASYDESQDAEIVARELKTEHYSQTIKPKIDYDLIKKLVWHSEEPTADSSLIPMYYLSEMTRSKVTMALAGDGADEILAGYETYQAYYLRKLYRFIPSFVRTAIIGRMVEALPTSMKKVSLDYKLKTFIRGAELPWQQAHYYWRIIFDEEEKKLLYNDAFRNEIGDYHTFDSIRPYFESTDNSGLNAMLEVDTKFYLPNDMLVKVDRASMAHSLEVRVPFLDHELIELVAKMPENLKLNKIGHRKFALKSIMRGRLPKRILRKRKLGFNVPINMWIQGPLRELVLDVLSPHALKRIGILDPKRVEWVINQHLRGKRDLGYQIWSLLILMTWWDMFINSNYSQAS
jgi:asparagine synthase (glutamine-hydrolysing)